MAIVNLDTPLSQDIPKGAEVTGVSRSSRSILVRGRTKEAWKAGDTVVLVEYAISADQGNVSAVCSCRVSLDIISAEDDAFSMFSFCVDSF